MADKVNVHEIKKGKNLELLTNAGEVSLKKSVNLEKTAANPLGTVFINPLNNMGWPIRE